VLSLRAMLLAGDEISSAINSRKRRNLQVGVGLEVDSPSQTVTRLGREGLDL
jgi:hypothetical protein